MDPGKVNFAWCLYQDGVKDVGWVTPMPTVGMDEEFINDFIELLTRINPDYVVLERFMIRNRGQSVLAEIINQMLGRIAILSRIYGTADVTQLTAAQWKNWWRKEKGADSWHEVYASVKNIHQRDACGIAYYFDEYWIPKNLK